MSYAYGEQSITVKNQIRMGRCSVLTLEGRSDGSGELEACIDSGAYPSAVVGATTLIGPQRSTGLQQRW